MAHLHQKHFSDDEKVFEMTDRIKGVLVTFEGDIRDDDCERYIELIRAIRRVQRVEPYITGLEDYISYQKGYHDAVTSFYDWVKDGMDGKKPPK